MPEEATLNSAAAEAASEPDGVGEQAEGTIPGNKGPSPLVLIGAAFVAGVVMARWLDWRERARAAV